MPVFTSAADGGQGFLWSALDDFALVSGTNTSSVQFTLSDRFGNPYTFKGTFTGYDSKSLPTGGTITGIVYDDPVWTTVTGLSISVALFRQWLANGNELAFKDALYNGNDTMIGGPNRDYFVGDGGNDTMDGGAGTDEVSYFNSPAGVTVDLLITAAQNTGGGGIDTIVNVEDVVGTAFSDTLKGNGGTEWIWGHGGNDTLVSRSGGTTLYGGDGDDLILMVSDPTFNAGRIGGDAGIDTVSFENASLGVVAESGGPGQAGSYRFVRPGNSSQASESYLSQVENLTGTAFADALWVNWAATTLRGLAGDDFLVSGAFNDTLDGGSGSDTIFYSDQYRITSGVTIDLRIATAQTTGGGGVDTVISIENIDGSQFADVLTGNADNNNLSGNNGNDTLSGGDGNDVLNGGAGSDGLNGGLGRDVAVYNSTSDYVRLTLNGNGSWTAAAMYMNGFGQWVPDPAHTDTLTGIEVVRFTDRHVVVSAAAASDLNGDGLNDILWRNADGTVDAWLTQGGAGYGFADANQGIVDTAWTIAQQGDFNGDGKNDLLWRHAGGNTNLWLSNAGSGLAVFTGQGLGEIASAWTIQQAGDFNGDGKSDVVWRHADGTVNIWASNSGAGYTGFTGAGFGAIDNAWQIKGADDFNGDGRADLLWRHSGGSVNIWLSNAISGPVSFAGDNLGVIPADWTVQGTGDFNGDGKADVLWRHLDGAVNVWLSNSGTGFTGLTGNGLGVIPADWAVKDVADYNGDGKADIAWRHADGSLNLWMSNAGQGFTGLTGQLVATVSNDWAIV